MTIELGATPQRKWPTKIDVEVEMPAIPNFIRFGSLTLPIGQVSRKVLRKVGAAWVAELVKRGRRE